MNDGGWSTRGLIPGCCAAEPNGGSVPLRLAHYITLSMNTLRRDASLAFDVEAAKHETSREQHAQKDSTRAVHVDDEEVGISEARRKQEPSS